MFKNYNKYMNKKNKDIGVFPHYTFVELKRLSKNKKEQAKLKSL